MIPYSYYLVDLMCSWHRQFPSTTIAVMNELCKRTGAKIVFNTTHNNPMKDVPDIEVALVEQGLLKEYLHPTDLKTPYPGMARNLAVEDWLRRHPEVEMWVALDDVKFTDDERLIWVDPDAGVTLYHLNMAIDLFGGGTHFWVL